MYLAFSLLQFDLKMYVVGQMIENNVSTPRHFENSKTKPFSQLHFKTDAVCWNGTKSTRYFYITLHDFLKIYSKFTWHFICCYKLI